MQAFPEDDGVKLLLVRVAKSLAAGLDPYDATRGIWKVDVKKAGEADLVLGISGGVVVTVFVPTRWKPATRVEFPRHPGEPDRRFAFDGVAPRSDIKEKYLGKRVPDRLLGGQNPIRYSW